MHTTLGERTMLHTRNWFKVALVFAAALLAFAACEQPTDSNNNGGGDDLDSNVGGNLPDTDLVDQNDLPSTDDFADTTGVTTPGSKEEALTAFATAVTQGASVLNYAQLPSEDAGTLEVDDFDFEADPPDTDAGFTVNYSSQTLTLTDEQNNTYGTLLYSANANGNLDVTVIRLGSAGDPYVGSATVGGTGNATVEIQETVTPPGATVQFPAGKLTAGYDVGADIAVTYADQPDDFGEYPPTELTLSNVSFEVVVQLALSISESGLQVAQQTQPIGGNLAATVSLTGSAGEFTVSNPEQLETDPTAVVEEFQNQTNTTVEITITAYDNDGAEVGQWSYAPEDLETVLGGSTGTTDTVTVSSLEGLALSRVVEASGELAL
jgi:hypothetical protein